MSTIQIRNKRHWILKNLALLVAAILIVAGVVWVVVPMHKAVKEYERPVVFDSQSVIRLHDISNVYKIQKDPFDTLSLWFGTAEGVVVLNLETFQWRRIGLDHGLPSEKVGAFCFTPENIWIATNKGLCLINRKSQKVQTFEDKKIVGRRIVELSFLPTRGILVCVENFGIHTIDELTMSVKHFKVSPFIDASSVSCIRNVGNGLYIGTESGTLDFLDLSTKSLQRFVFSGSMQKSSIVWDVLLRPEGMYVATSDAGVYFKKNGADTIVEDKTFPCKGAFALENEADGFFCATPYGLWRYHAHNNIWLQFVNPQQRKATDFSMASLVSDGDRLWFGALDGKSGYVTKTQVSWQKLRAGLSNPNVAALALGDSMLWTSYGYQGGYIDRFSKSTMQYDHNFGNMRGILDPTIATLMCVNDILYYGGFESFGYLQPQTGKSRHFTVSSGLPRADIADIKALDSFALVLATSSGLVRYTKQTSEFEFLQGSGPSRATCIAVVDTNIYYGTLTAGVRGYDLRSRREFTAFCENSSRIMGVDTINATTLFVATKSNGCYTFNMSSQKLTPITVPKKIVGTTVADDPNHIMCMKKIDSRIFLGTRDHGCFVYNVDTKTWNTFSFFNGLVTDQIRSFASDSATIFIGGYGGVTSVKKTYLDSIFSKQEIIAQ